MNHLHISKQTNKNLRNLNKILSYPFLYNSTSPNVITPITEIIIKEFANDCHSFVPVLEMMMIAVQ